MRSHLYALLVVAGCGSVRLGSEEPDDMADPGGEVDFDASATARADARGRDASDGASGLDAGTELRVVVTVGVPDAACASCVELTATGTMGTPPYTFEWDDGSKLARRTVCAPGGQDALSVIARDALGRVSPPHTMRVELGQGSCDASVSRPLLCLANPSFEGEPAYNTGLPTQFDAPPWSNCTQPSRFNVPEIVNDRVLQYVGALPDPTDGETFLGLRAGNQASQGLCAPIQVGERRSFWIGTRRIHLGLVTIESGDVYLSIFGGSSASCVVNEEALWVSPKLDAAWRNVCVTIAPSQDIDQLTLLASTDSLLPALVYVGVDHIVPVASCP